MPANRARFESVVHATQRTIAQLRKRAAALEADLSRLHPGDSRVPAADMVPVEGTTYVGNLVYPMDGGAARRSAPGIFRWSQILGWQGPGNTQYPPEEVEIMVSATAVAGVGQPS